MSRKKRFLTMLLAAVLGAAVLFSVAYIAEEVNHECTGAGCAVSRSACARTCSKLWAAQRWQPGLRPWCFPNSTAQLCHVRSVRKPIL